MFRYALAWCPSFSVLVGYDALHWGGNADATMPVEETFHQRHELSSGRQLTPVRDIFSLIYRMKLMRPATFRVGDPPSQVLVCSSWVT